MIATELVSSGVACVGKRQKKKGTNEKMKERETKAKYLTDFQAESEGVDGHKGL